MSNSQGKKESESDAYKYIDQMLSETNFQGFPVVQDRKNMILLGYIGRSELRYAIGKVENKAST